ncbi:hypothetical protein WJX77_009871 [Trebouxia sp. C0004]
MAEQHLTAKIKDIKSNGKPLVVLLKGPDKDSSMMEMILRTSGLATLRDQATLFVLSASEQATSMPPIVAALSRSSLPAISQTDLPMVIVLNGEGKALSVARGLVTAGELQQSLADAVASFQPQGGSLPLTSPHSGSAAAPNASPNALGKEVTSSNPAPTLAPLESRPAPLTAESATTAVPASTTAVSMTETAKSAGQQPPATTPVPAGIAVVPKEPLVHASQTVQLQIHLPDGQAVRGSFKGATTLQEVCHYVDQQSPGTCSRDCQLVSLHPPKEFSVSDLARSLAELGVQSQTSLRLRHTQASPGSRVGPIAQLMQLLRTLNPVTMLRWLASLFKNPNLDLHRDSGATTSQQHWQQPASGSATSRDAGASQAVKRRNAAPGKVHTVHDAGDEVESDDPDSNKYWNGNSTQFDGKDQ